MPPLCPASGYGLRPFSASGVLARWVWERTLDMSPEYYRHRAEECCRNAIRAEDIERRLHWLEAAARWLSLARQHPGPYKPGFPSSRSGKSAPGRDVHERLFWIRDRSYLIF